MDEIGLERTDQIVLQFDVCDEALESAARMQRADNMACWGNSLSRSLLGVKRTWAVAPHMSAFDPKRTSTPQATSVLRATIKTIWNSKYLCLLDID
jgi:hypothetical protein